MQKFPDLIIHQYDFNLSYARKLVEDLTEDQMTVVPAGGLENHPAFTLGHLVSGSAMVAEDMGSVFEMPAGWSDLFLRKGPGDPTRPDPDKSKYPAKNILLEERKRVGTLSRQAGLRCFCCRFKRTRFKHSCNKQQFKVRAHGMYQRGNSRLH